MLTLANRFYQLHQDVGSSRLAVPPTGVRSPEEEALGEEDISLPHRFARPSHDASAIERTQDAGTDATS